MKTKWNWGTKLAIWIVAFIVFMLTLVYMTTTSKVNLVEEDYYPKGLAYQTRIDAIKNAKDINAEFITSQNINNVIITIPNIKVDTGTVLFFRPSGNSLDMSYNLLPNNEQKMVFPKSDFTRGKYILKINWQYQNIEYYVEQVFFVK